MSILGCPIAQLSCQVCAYQNGVHNRALTGSVWLLQADQCKPQQIANIMWAFGTLSFKPQQRLVELLAREAVSKLSGFNPQNLANFIWAYAR